MCFLVMLFIYLVTPGSAEHVASYAGAQVWQTNLRSARDVEVIRTLADQQVISLWSLNSRVADFLIRAQDKARVSRVLRARGLRSATLIDDVQWTLDKLPAPSAAWTEDALRNGHRLDWQNYPTLPVIFEYLQYLAKNYPSICTLKTIGRTGENNPLQVLRISNKNPKNKIIVITAGVHAREWISITSALYLIDTIVTKLDQLPDYIRSFDWNIIPVLNPDGYIYSYTKDRLWRKNRKQTRNPDCVGIDVNRNFGAFTSHSMVYQMYISMCTRTVNSLCTLGLPSLRHRRKMMTGFTCMDWVL